MASVQLTLAGSNVVQYQLPSFSGRVTVTIMSNAAEVWATSDGNVPAAPSGTVATSGNQKTLAGVLGGQMVLFPVQFGSHMVAPLIQLASSGTPTIELEW